MGMQLNIVIQVTKLLCFFCFILFLLADKSVPRDMLLSSLRALSDYKETLIILI